MTKQASFHFSFVNGALLWYGLGIDFLIVSCCFFSVTQSVSQNYLPESLCCFVLIRLVFWKTQQRWSMANMVTIITALWSSSVTSNCFPILQQR